MIKKDYTKEMVRNLISIVKECAREGRFTISLEGNKLENMQFIEEYNVNEEKIIDMLTLLNVEDFCYGLENMKDGVIYNDLYVFCPIRQLYNIKGKKETVDVYMRFNIIESGENNYRMIVSLHKRNKPITYIFK
ncbi:MAG: hypothetical protein ACI398_06415 [Clostridium sp.]